MGSPVQGSQQNIIDISGTISESNQLFDLENIKPGDWADRELIISNKRNNDITYDIEIAYEDGSKMFYDALFLEIKSAGNQLYYDKLANFTTIKDLTLAANEEEILEMQLTFPPESGNEFQGLTTKATITIISQDDIDEESSTFTISTDSQSMDNDSFLPATATFAFNFLIIGLALLLVGSIIYLIIKKKKIA